VRICVWASFGRDVLAFKYGTMLGIDTRGLWLGNAKEARKADVESLVLQWDDMAIQELTRWCARDTPAFDSSFLAALLYLCLYKSL